MIDSQTLGGDYRILFVNFLSLSGGGQQVQQYLNPKPLVSLHLLSTKLMTTTLIHKSSTTSQSYGHE